jgi:DNA-binding winged helix-turn-helix (wHTH) protein
MRFEFGDCRLDTDRYELHRAGVGQPVEPQVFDVLVVLLREHGRMVSKERLMDAVWGSRFISESALTSRIKDARRAIGDDGREQRLIRTVHGRGYQFVGDVVVAEGAPSDRPALGFRLDATDLLERDEQLATLAAAYDAAAGGRGSVVLVGGEPGIGKTALVTSFAAGMEGGRVLWGACDDLLTPKPLGPLRDIAGDFTNSLERMIAEGAAPHELHGRLLAELSAPPAPTVLVIEDVHWADDATLDALSVVGRRIVMLPAVLVLTFRAGEVADGHPLYAALAAVRTATTRDIQLGPLSRAAVETLAGDRTDTVYAASGGTPFYVTELLATEADVVPPSVVHAVLGRAARLDDGARRLVELVSMIPTRTSTRVLDVVMPTWTREAEEPERRHLLQVAPDYVRFRHELSRHAILANVPGARRRRLHAEILEALLKLGADPADVVHHAEASGALDIAADHALVAARRAAAVGSHREAYSQFVRAARFVDRLSLTSQAGLFEELAMMAYMVVRMPEAFEALDRAIGIYQALGDREAVGRCTRVRSRFHWYAGAGDESMADARAAVAILEPLGETVELARAYSGLSQLAMLASRDAEALSWGERAATLATRLGDDRTRAHALVNIGTVRVQSDVDDTATLEEAHRLADATGDRHEAVRALLNVGYTAMTWLRPDVASQFADRAIAYASEYQVDTLLSYLNSMTAWLAARRGELGTADRIARAEVATGGMGQLLAQIVLAELAVRRGDPDAPERLAELAAQADRTGELQRIAPVLALEVEWSLTTGAPLPVERFARAIELAESAAAWGNAWSGAELAGWATVAGIDVSVRDVPVPRVYGAMVRRDWRAAADLYGAAGWAYDRALMLSLLDDETALTEALETARDLGTRPLLERVIARKRDGG